MAKKKQIVSDTDVKEDEVKRLLEEQRELDYNTKRVNYKKQHIPVTFRRNEPPTMTSITLAQVGDKWIDTSKGDTYLCTDDTTNEEKWLLIQQHNIQREETIVEQQPIILKRRDTYWSLPHTKEDTRTQQHTSHILVSLV